MKIKNTVFTIIILILLSALFILFQTGCSDDPKSTYIVQTPTGTNIFPGSQEVIAQYFTSSMVSQMERDAMAITMQYGGINVFSTAQYGRRFITGTAKIKDIFDARIPENYEIFKKYAWDNFSIKGNYFERYAKVANQFMAEFEYDGVLFHPDELHPVFTQENDTWLFLRDAPTNVCDIYYSQRVENRKISISGGIKMRALTASDPLGVSQWMYYVPADGASYEAYTDNVRTATQLTYSLVTGQSNYVPRDASQQALEKRNLYGIISSPLSNREVKVGGWKNESYADDMVKNGFSFRADPESSTWGGWGLYLIVLEKNYWE